jgi:KTSC domain
MQRTPLASSTLRSAGYDEATSELEIEFQSGRVYRFSGVPAGVYAWLVRSPGKGGLFNRMIRDRYAYTDVTEVRAATADVDLLEALRRSLEPAAAGDGNGPQPPRADAAGRPRDPQRR